MVAPEIAWISLGAEGVCLTTSRGSRSLFSNWPEKNGSGALAPSPGVSD